MSYHTNKIYRSVSAGLSISTVNAAIALAISHQPEVIGIAVTDETTALSTGNSIVTFRMPFAMTLTEVRAGLNVAADNPGDPVRVQIKQNGVAVLSTQCFIDNLELTSKTATIQPVIATPSLADDAQMTVDVVTATAGSPAGLKIWLIGTRT